MKHLLLILSICFFFQGCSECEHLTADLESDVLPLDPDPDPTCAGTFYASYLTLNTEGNIETRNFISFPKPKNEPFDFTALDMVTGDGLQNGGQDGYNHSAYNAMSDTYAFAYQFGVGVTNPLYIAATNPFASTLSTKEFQYAAPVYNTNTLYVIDVFDGGDVIDYSISSLNESTGDPTVLFIGTENTTEPFNNSFISSATDGGDMLYFIGFTTLVSYSISANTATVLNIDVESNPSSQLLYYGLEYQQDSQRLLAIKERFNSSDLIGELVSVSTDGAGTVQTVYDIQSNLSAENDGVISPQFYSTAFSQCDNVYHITELDELEPDGFGLRSNIIDINVDQSTLNEIQVEGLVYGLEIDEN